MIRKHLAVIVGFCLCLSSIMGAFEVPVFAQANGITDGDVEDAIEDLKKFFFRKFDHQKGNWESLYRSQNGGKGAITAMIVQALIQSGESSQRPEIKRAIQYLASVKTDRTYGLSVRCHVWAQLPDQYLPQLRHDAKVLEKDSADVNATFTYFPRPLGKKIHNNSDHSTTHYGVLGLWEASKRGVPVQRSFWIRSQNHWVSAQNKTGGWSYVGNPETGATSSMTAAGTTVLLIAQQELYRDALSPDPEITGSINEGLDWLDKKFGVMRKPELEGAAGYFLYAMERVSLASGRRHYNKLDWFRVGATNFLKAQLGDGSVGFRGVSSAFDSAFALMFLTRGRVPVWMNKISIPDLNTRWNNRPNDAYYLTKFINSQFEQQVSWQVIDIDEDPQQWLDAPIAYLAADSKFELNKQRLANVKSFLDKGGLLLASPDNTGNGVDPFVDSVKAMAKKMYPNLKFKQLPNDHHIFSLLYQMQGMAGQKVYSLSNGARDLIILPERDWGYLFQSEKQGKQPTTVFKLAANFYAMATDRGRLKLVNRLSPHFQPRANRKPIGQVEIARARYRSADSQWLTEPLAWQQVSNFVFTMFGVDVDYTSRDTDLSRVGLSNAPLLHLTGTHPIELQRRELSELDRYIRRGGTVLVENIGGKTVKVKGRNGKMVETSFAESIEYQMAAFGDKFKAFKPAAVPLDARHPIITSKGMIGGFDNRFPKYRPYAIQVFGRPVIGPRLAAIHLPDKDGKFRPAVIFSREDLSLGMMGVRHYGIIGYSLESSRNIMTNIAIYAYERSKKK